MHAARNGRDHIESLRDGRDVSINGARVADVTEHKAFRNAVRSAARLYDFQADPERIEAMTFASPQTGRRVSRCWQLPKDYAELVERRRALAAWAELHFGFMGRSPDHVASCISGMYMGLDLFEAHDRKRAAAVRDYYRFARDHDLFLTYVIINPQADRSKAAHAQADPFLAAGVVDEDAEGLTIRGAKMLGTSGIMANEVFVTCIQPLSPGDERQAVSFVVPMNAKGLRVLSRKSYEEHAVSRFDNPLSSQYDENDAVLYFDDVKVPWERVFVNQDIDMTLKQFHATPAHVYQNYQCQIRLLVKMRFLAGIAHRIAEANGIIGFPQVRDTLGQIAAEVGLVDGLLHGMEAKGAPGRRLLRAGPASPLFGADAHPAALSQGDHHDPRPRRRRAHHGAFQHRRFRRSRPRRHHRQDPEVAGVQPAGAGEILQARLGRARFGIRLAARAVRNVLCRRFVRHPRPLLPHLRLGNVQGHGGRTDGELSDAGGAEESCRVVARVSVSETRDGIANEIARSRISQALIRATLAGQVRKSDIIARRTQK